MKFLFLHQNFPGQFKFLAPALVRAGHEVVALTLRKGAEEWNGVKVRRYAISRGTTQNAHPWIKDTETKVIRGEACFHAMFALADAGFTPDAVIANHGWGESLFVKEVWPGAKLGIYCEAFYRARGLDVDFDPEISNMGSGAGACAIRVKNLNNYAHMDIADAAISPTDFQASTFPDWFRPKITIAHDGIDTAAVRPNEAACFPLADDRTLTRQDEVITFVNRNLEPLRGYHSFMRALPQILASRPEARVVIVGGDGVSYSQAAPAGQTWREIFLNEVSPQMTAEQIARIHFVGQVPYPDFVALLQVSRVHVYLTYPFVLGWSLIEAMSAGCAIVGSDTAPVQEAIRDGETGVLVDFFDIAGLSGAICDLLEDPGKRVRLGRAARADAIARFDLATVCLPQQIAWAEGLAAGKLGDDTEAHLA